MLCIITKGRKRRGKQKKAYLLYNTSYLLQHLLFAYQTQAQAQSQALTLPRRFSIFHIHNFVINQGKCASLPFHPIPPKACLLARLLALHCKRRQISLPRDYYSGTVRPKEKTVVSDIGYEARKEILHLNFHSENIGKRQTPRTTNIR